MKREHGICEECGRRTAVIYAHANLCEWCWPAGSQAEPDPANGGPACRGAGRPREAQTKPACRDCGAELSGARRGRCLDCEVNHAFDRFGEQIEARRHSTTPRTGGPAS